MFLKSQLSHQKLKKKKGKQIAPCNGQKWKCPSSGHFSNSKGRTTKSWREITSSETKPIFYSTGHRSWWNSANLGAPQPQAHKHLQDLVQPRNQLSRTCQKQRSHFPKTSALQPDSLSQQSGSQPRRLLSCYTLQLLLPGRPRSHTCVRIHRHSPPDPAFLAIWVGSLLGENWETESR